MQSTPRRTQAQRREATKGRLVEATIVCLDEFGYAKASVATICKHAGVSSGAMFRHFPTRRDLIVATADAIANLHLAQFEAVPAARAETAETSETATADRSAAYLAIVGLIRELARSPSHSAWREIMIAARTDADLRAAAKSGLERFEAALIDTSARVLGVPRSQAQAAAVVILSVMHMFDSEAVTVVVHDNPPLEQARLQWAAALLAREFGDQVH